MTSNGNVSIDELLAKIGGVTDEDDRPVRKVPMPEWGFDAYIRAMPGYDRDALEQWQSENEDKRGFRAKVIALHLCGSDGSQRQIKESEVLALSARSSKAIARLVDACLEESGYTKEDVEKLEGNSEGGTSEESG